MKKNMLDRLSIFAAVLAPAAILPLSSKLAQPMEIWLWIMATSALMASIPSKRGASLCAAAFSPVFLAWAAAVAATGVGPNPTLIGTALHSGAGELAASSWMAIRNPAFLVVLVLSVITNAIALKRTRGTNEKTSETSKAVFLAMMSGVIGMAYGIEKTVPGSEARVSVPMLSAGGFVSAGINGMINLATIGTFGTEASVRDAKAARKTFEARTGTVILVIGESLRADDLLDLKRGASSIKMQERIDSGLAARGPDACSGANETFLSVPRLLTGADVSDQTTADGSPTVLALARAAGYKTAWISNQEDLVVNEQGHDFITQTAAAHGSKVDDMETISEFSRWVSRTEGKKAALIHLYGQHYVYADRYPSGEFPKIPSGLTEMEKDRLEYERAAEHGVSVLLRAAEVMDGLHEPAVMVFTSDHGENLLSDGRGLKLHAGPVPNRHDSTVPFLIVWNRAMAESGRLDALKPLLDTKQLIAHKNITSSWLSLAGKLGEIEIDTNPRIWSGGRSVSCSDLK